MKKWYCRRKETQIRNQHRKLSLEVSLPKVSDDSQFPRQLRPWYPSGIGSKMNASANLLSYQIQPVFLQFSYCRSSFELFWIVKERDLNNFTFWSVPEGYHGRSCRGNWKSSLTFGRDTSRLSFLCWFRICVSFLLQYHFFTENRSCIVVKIKLYQSRRHSGPKESLFPTNSLRSYTVLV